MKIVRHNPNVLHDGVKHCFTRSLSRPWLAVGLLIVCGSSAVAQSDLPIPPRTDLATELATDLTSPAAFQQPSDPANELPALSLIEQVIDRLANGPAFDGKVRQRVRAAGREIVGVGTYTQVGGGTGRFAMQMTMMDGEGKHTLHQVSDGRLAWTRTEIGDEVSLTRVDVGWLDEGARTLRRQDRIKPSMKVGGLTEMLDTIRRDYDLHLGLSQLDGRRLYVIVGNLKSSRRETIEQDLRGDKWPALYPTRVHVAVTADNEPDSDFGKGLPVRIEHWGDPSEESEIDDPRTIAERQRAPEAKPTRQLISLFEFYSIQPITPPPIDKFQLENQDASITFVNETSRYEDRFDIRVSAKERAKYR
ncbi:hypothetical protein FYK55_20545 [Roseiconus nitratireducens]|uniref:Uncharacterized protein n=1 Tax=Roseiconus nitratireducens TaxID=2605748 RepID=A0A5M6CYV7_9BACT|nr:hypothetical protein [Roseiconus nitratireducens]KAA5540408.1 hypothetical protein FYK55_20545 [Roseiconus nitratireducens]